MMPRRSSRAPEPNGVADFDLAPLKSFRPEGIIARDGKERFGAFMLALATAFNDLKGLLYWRRLILQKSTGMRGVSPRVGQLAGMELQVQRLILAHLHEFLELLKAFKEESRGEEMRALLRTAPLGTQRQWEDLVRFATGEGDARDAQFTKVLVIVRNNAAAHYYQPNALVGGFRRHFYELRPAPNNAAAYASIGINMEQTRFYYADAALQAFIEKLPSAVGAEQFRRRLTRVGNGINQTIAHIVTEYLKPALIP